MEKREKRVLVKEKEKVMELPVFQKDLDVVGKSEIRVDALDKVRGKLEYVADLEFPGALHGKVLRSPYPHALIKSIHIEKAKGLPGVAAVLTSKDVPGRNGIGVVIPDQPVICGDKVRYVGDGVALVAAETEEIAIQALGLIEVEYEPLPPVLSPEEALRPDAPKIHEKGNLLTTSKIRKGDTVKGFEQAEVILERTYRVPFLEHMYLEPDVTLVTPHREGWISIKGPMQAPFTTRKNIAAVLGLPMNKVQCIQTPIGGGFGGKEDSPIDIGARAAVLAWKTGRPVKMEYDREEITLTTAKRHPMIIHCKIGAKKDGTFVAFEGTILDEQGAYASLGPLIPPAGGVHAHAVIMLPGPYVIPHVRVDGHLLYTNHPYGGAMRGFGAPQVNFAHESLVDELAEILGMDPFDLRMKNCVDLGSQTATGQVLDQSVGLKDTMEKSRDAFGWVKLRKPVPTLKEIEKEDKRRGVGMAVGWYRTSLGTSFDGAGANLHLMDDGSVLVYQGLTEMGQGLFTTLSQIAAEALGVSVEDVRMVVPDTDVAPESGPTVASRSTTLMGNAILMAAEMIKKPLMESASELLGLPADRLVARNRLIYDRDNPDHCIELKEAAKRSMMLGRRLMGQGWYTPPRASLDQETGQGTPYFVFTYSAQMAEVEVDLKTGEVEVIKLVAAFDIGKAINPRMVEGQIEGGVLMGLGYALMEELVIKDGMTQNLSFQDYIIPTAMDMPEIVPIIVEHPNVHGPFGAKGIGEMPNIPAAPAITNAIANATGARIYDLPAHSERVYDSIKNRLKKND
jgi:CO/xanthine dehydrogenase Mo-binding subunit